MRAFLQLRIGSTLGTAQHSWEDVSTPNRYVFQAAGVRLSLAKRSSYPSTFVFVKNDVLYFGYGSSQRAASILGQPLRNVPESAFYRDEFLLGIINLNGDCWLQRDAYCTLPLFAATTQNELALSNIYEELLPLAKNSLSVDNLGLCEFVAGFDTYYRTYAKNITALGERSRINWRPGRGLFRWWPADSSYVATHNDQSYDPQFFRIIFEQTIDRYADTYIAKQGSAGCELSGGLDSSIVAGSLAQRTHALHCVTLEFPGHFGISQGRKLDDLRQRFALSDSYILPLDTGTLFPLSRLLAPEAVKPFYHYESIYLEAFGHLADHLAQHNVHTVFTGIGGDELCAYDAYPLRATGEGEDALYERQNRTLWPFLSRRFKDYYHSSLAQLRMARANAVPIIASASLAAKITHNNIYLHHGIWPVAPLADPELFLYCQRLPLQYRANKNILRMYCAANNYPLSLYNASQNEDFRPYFLATARRQFGQLLNVLLVNSVLAKADFIESPEHVLSWFNALKPALTEADEGYYDAYRFIVLEHNLQSLGITLLP